MPKVSPEVLKWARETAGLTRDAAANKLGIAAAYGRKPAQRLAAFESGDAEPTEALLDKMARQYRRPLVAFYLPSPPPTADRIADFRTVTQGRTPKSEALLDALVRKVISRQGMVRALLECEGEAQVLPFIGTRTVSEGTEAVLDDVKNLLGITCKAYRTCSDVTSAFALLREKAEQAGIFVLLVRDLGSYHTTFETSVFRGFSIADKFSPFIVINSNDSKPARSFTLLHELTHLILGKGAIGGSFGDNPIERFCDEVAARFLLPDEDLEGLNIDSISDLNTIEKQVSDFARQRHLSRTMVAFAANRRGQLSDFMFRELANRFRGQWQKLEGTNNSGKASSGGPNYYVVTRHRVGNALVGLTERMLFARAISVSKAALILDVKPRNVPKLFEKSRS